jgi:sugar lactone lactonase YvrE
MAIGSVQSVTADAVGNTYFVTFHCVFKLDQNGVVTLIAGNGRAGYSGDGGPATSAQLQLQSVGLGSVWVGGGALPPGMAVDNGGNVYVADNGNYRVRRISPDGVITTVAGNGTPGFSGDGGPAASAQLSPVFGLAIDVSGNLLIADSGANRIRQVTPDGNIATVAGAGDCGFSGDGGPAAVAQFCGPAGIAADTAGNLFITDSENYRIRRITPDGIITTVAGTGMPDYTDLGDCGPSGDGGQATSATLCLPSNVAVDQAGNLLVADTYEGFLASSQAVRRISPGGTITTVAGVPCSDWWTWPLALCHNPLTDGIIATGTYLEGPLGLAVDNSGSLLIADGAGMLIRKVSWDGSIATIAGNGQAPSSGDGGPATSALLASPGGVAVDSAGNVFIADSGNYRIREVTPGGIITTVAGNGTYGSSGDGGPATSAQMEPINVALDAAGNLFLFDRPNRRVRKVSSGGMITTVTFVGGNNYTVAADSAGDVFFGSIVAVIEISPDGTIHTVAGSTFGFSGDGGPATNAQLAYPGGVALDGAGNLYIADIQNHRVRKVTPDGIISTIAGSSTTTSNTGCCHPSPGGFSGDGGPAIDAQLSFPADVAVDVAGNVYIADWGNNRIRKVSTDGIITTIAGNGIQGYSGDGGPASSASLSGPTALAVDGGGNIYVADPGNNAIRILQPVGQSMMSTVKAQGRER